LPFLGLFETFGEREGLVFKAFEGKSTFGPLSLTIEKGQLCVRSQFWEYCKISTAIRA